MLNATEATATPPVRDHIDLNKARALPPAFDGRLAHRAYIAMPDREPAQRLVILTRGDLGLFISLERGIAKLNAYQLRALASKLNSELGVSDDAAEALHIDWQCGFKAAPVDPADLPGFRRDERDRRSAYEGRQVARGLSGGYLRVLAGSHNLPLNDAICPGSFRHTWLMAHAEFEWANINGRVEWADSPSLARVLSTERAAILVCQAARALSNAKAVLANNAPAMERLHRRGAHTHEGKRHRLTKRSLAAADRIAAWRASPERRSAVLDARAKSRPALQLLLKAIGLYQRARAKHEAA